MHTLKPAALAILLIFGTATAQEIEKKIQMKVMLVGDGGEETSDVSWSSDHLDFDMQDLAVGESRTIENEDGQTVIITRAEAGFDVDVDGNTVRMPDIGAHEMHMASVGDRVIHEEIDVDSSMHVMKSHHPQGVTIVSEQPLDQSVQDSIRSVLISAGNNEDVTFIDGSQAGKRVMVRKIEVIEP